MAMKEINPGTWTYEKDGDSISGIFLRAEKDVGENKSMMYYLESNGEPISIWGSAILDKRMLFVNPGDLIEITYKGLGEKKAGKNAPKIFKVSKDDGSKEEPIPTE